MATEPTTPVGDKPEGDDRSRDADISGRWIAEIDFATREPNYVAWCEKVQKINRRYRDERKTIAQNQKKFNILWSNVQTLMPAVYSKMPKPIVERRFMDRDPSARLSSIILERTSAFQMEVGYYHHSTQKAVLDYLLGGMGQVWLRYEPTFETVAEGEENAEVEQAETEAGDTEALTASEVAENGDGVPYERLTYERVCVDFVHYRDFLWGSARCWQEVPWVARRTYLTRSEIAEKFYSGDMEMASRITLDYQPRQPSNGGDMTDRAASYFCKAEVWEIWNKADRTVYFIPTGTPGVVLNEVSDPELKLENFWPCPEPLFSTQTNDSLIPVPDYHEYEDQAEQLDVLTNRIAMVTTAIRANGVYDSSFPALQRLMMDGQDNKLIPVDSWAAFAEKGGMKGAFELVPMREIAEVLIRLYEARERVKNDLYEVTGISDIVRGQSGGPSKTATEQRIKGQFASLRLQDRQDRVARFCREVLRIEAEIIAEMFSEQSLMQMSGVDQMMADEVRKAVADVPPPQPPQLPEGAPPELAQQAQQMALMQHQQAQHQAAMQAQQAEQEKFAGALRILRSDRLRGFRVDIETDSTIQPDAEAAKASAVELFQSTMAGIQAIAPIIQQAPALMEPIGNMLMYTYRQFRVGRSMEASLEDALVELKEQMAKAAENPQPNPEQLKAQAEIQKQQMETQRDQQKFQMDMQAKQADFALDQQKAKAQIELQREKDAMDLFRAREELTLERERMEIERRKMDMQLLAAQDKAAVSAQSAALQSQAQREKHAMAMEARAADQQAPANP